MTFNTYGDKANPGLLLIPGLGDQAPSKSNI